MLILGICAVGAAFIISGAITGAAAAAKESAPQSLQQPMLSFFTEFDAADYLGISLNELDYMRGEGMLDNTFVAVTSMEQTGEEEYYAMEDGLEVIKLRPVMAPVTRFLFNRQLLDERMLQLIKEGKHVNPTRAKGANSSKPNKPNKNNNGQKKNNENRNNENKNGENRNNNQKKNNENKTEHRENDSTKIYNGKKSGERDNNNNNGNNNKPRPEKRSDNENSKPNKRPSIIDDDDDFFSKGAKGEHGRNSSGKPGISYEDDSSDTKVVDLVSSSYFDD